MWKYLKGKAWKVVLGYAVKYVAVLILTTTLLKINHDTSMRVRDDIRVYDTHSMCTITDTYIVDRVCVAEVTTTHAPNDTHFATSYYGRQWDTHTAEAAEDFCTDHPVGMTESCLIANDTMRVLFISQYESAIHYARHEILRYRTNLSVGITIDITLTIIPIVLLVVKVYIDNKKSSLQVPEPLHEPFLDPDPIYKTSIYEAPVFSLSDEQIL
jgi:hypothetical protein